jgi:hypothetical protein
MLVFDFRTEQWRAGPKAFVTERSPWEAALTDAADRKKLGPTDLDRKPAAARRTQKRE